MIERHNIAIEFLKMQGQQLYRIPKDREFSFAYHPWNSANAPEIGYIIKKDETLRKIFRMKPSKHSTDLPTIILHIVFEEQYHVYEANSSPFSYKKSLPTKPKPFKDIEPLNSDLNQLNTYDNTHAKNSPKGVIGSDNGLTDEPSTTRHRKRLSKGNTLTSHKTSYDQPQTTKLGHLDPQKFVFIRVKNKHEYEMNPKLIKFFIAEMLKDERNRAKLHNMSNKINSVSKEKVIKFGLQHYVNVMDEVVSVMEDSIKDHEYVRQAKLSAQHQHTDSLEHNSQLNQTSHFEPHSEALDTYSKGFRFVTYS